MNITRAIIILMTIMVLAIVLVVKQAMRADDTVALKLDSLQMQYNSVCVKYDTLPACVGAKATLKEFGR